MTRLFLPTIDVDGNLCTSGLAGVVSGSSLATPNTLYVTATGSDSNDCQALTVTGAHRTPTATPAPIEARMLRYLAAVLALALLAAFPAQAQQTVVSSCGSPSSQYTAGSTANETQDTNGNTCTY